MRPRSLSLFACSRTTALVRLWLGRTPRRTRGPRYASVIFGTGTNAAYMERLANIERLGSEAQSQGQSPDAAMVINTEWGSFDDDMKVLPRTFI